MNSALSPAQRPSIFVFFLLRASPRPTPPGLEAPGKVSRVPGPGYCSSRLCPKPAAVPSAAYGRQPPAYTPSCHTEAVWSCAAGLTLSLHPFVGHGVLSAGFPQGGGGGLKVVPCLPFPVRRSVAPNCCFLTVPRLLIPQILGAVGVCVRVCVRVGSELCTSERSYAGDMLGAAGSLLPTVAEWGG
ncbi:hypothetical protein ACRRTK_012513 [Alexandromys fortis]